MKKLKEFTFDISKIAEDARKKLINQINLIESCVPLIVKNNLVISALVEEVSPDDKEGAEELKKEILDIIATYSFKDEPQVQGPDKKIMVTIDPSDLEKLNKINAEFGKTLMIVPAATVEESKYGSFIKECSKNNIRIVKTERIDESFNMPSRVILIKDKLDALEKENKGLTKDFVKGIIFSVYGEEGIPDVEKAFWDATYPNIHGKIK